MKWLSNLHIKIVNSNFWFHIYYKHTKKHKKDLADTYAEVVAFRKSVINK